MDEIIPVSAKQGMYRHMGNDLNVSCWYFYYTILQCKQFCSQILTEVTSGF